MRTIRVSTFLVGLTVVLPTTARATDDATVDAELAREARLPTVLGLALGRNPEVLETRERVLAARARAEAASGLPDAELKYEQWGVPLRNPVALNRADTLMLGLRQALPAPGTRSARQRMANEEAAGVMESERTREREIAAQVRRTYVQYWRAEQEYRIHLEHVGLLSQIVELSRGRYQSGRGTQQDLLRLTVELSQLHTDVANLEQERRSNRALLNALMGRPPDAPLGPASDGAITMDAAAAPKPHADASASRPEIAAAARAVSRSEAALDLARTTARWPSLMIGADYWYMPMLNTPHGYGAMVSINLPWLNPRHRAEIREAEHALAADRRALTSQLNVASYEARDTTARMEAARQGVLVLDVDLLPQARRSYESAQAAYASGQGSALSLLDSLRAYLQVRLERSRALARFEVSRADQDRARGEQP
jgi:outer membrane protein TolC